MRPALFLATALGCEGGGGSGGASTATAPDIAGVWAVTMRYDDGSCPDMKGGSQASMWTVNRDDKGAYEVAVQGDEKVPVLHGDEDGDHIVLVGVAGSSSATTTQWRLSGSTKDLTGRAIQTRIAKSGIKVQTILGERETHVTCAVVWTVQATKQSK